MNKKMIMLILAVVLVLLIGVQAYELNVLKKNINGDFGLETGTFSSATTAKQSSPAAAPQMVGGC